MEKVTITFVDGTYIEAERNGDCYITGIEPTFPRDLSLVVIVGNNYDRTVEHAELIECASVDGRYWFTFNEIPENIRTTKQIQANIEYIAMMTDVDLEEA